MPPDPPNSRVTTQCKGATYTAGGGGGSLIFSAYVGSDPASTIHPQKIPGISATSKNIWNFSNPKNIPILHIDLKKRP